MPNSIIWIGLVVFWVFVLFPMLADRHPRIRRTTDTALATRVLHRGGSPRRTKTGPATGHDSDPDWRPTTRGTGPPHSDDAEDRMTILADAPVTEQLDHIANPPPGPEEGDPDTGSLARIPPAATNPAAQAPKQQEFVVHRRGRGGFDPEADARVRATRYAFRRRTVAVLITILVGCAGLAVSLAAPFWWGCLIASATLITYLAYLRVQVRRETEIRRRRSARLTHTAEHLAPEPEAEHQRMDRDTARALRRRSALLEPDDNHPAFAYLTPFDPTTARTTRRRAASADLRHAVGE